MLNGEALPSLLQSTGAPVVV